MKDVAVPTEHRESSTDASLDLVLSNDVNQVNVTQVEDDYILVDLNYMMKKFEETTTITLWDWIWS